MIRAVIFDVDGVLVQSGVFGRRLRELGIDPASLQSFWHGPFAECSIGRADLKQSLPPFIEQWGYPGSVEDCLQAWFEADSTLNHPLLEEIASLRAGGVPVFFTIDAGPQLKAVCAPGARGQVERVLSTVPGVLELLTSALGPGAELC